MMRTHIKILLLSCLSVLAFAACASKPPVKSAAPAASSSSENSGANSAGADASNAAAGAGTRALGAGAGGPGGPLARVIYFDFDSAEIRPEFIDVVAGHARALAANASIKIRLEGNTDERGSREYNIGLGERRAQSVRRALLLQGVTEAQVSTVSYGEERPAVTGHTEEAWAKNRRVEFVYLN